MRPLTALHSISSAINESTSLDDIIHVAADRIMDTLVVDAVLLFMINKKTELLELKAYRGVDRAFARGVDNLAIGEGFNGHVALTGEASVISNAEEDHRLSRDVVVTNNIRSFFIVPIKFRDTIVGTLSIARRDQRTFTVSEQELIALIGIELGIAAQKVSYFQQAQNNLRLYSEKVSAAHEDERTRIARELHDDTIQGLVATSRRLDNFMCHNSSMSSLELRPLEDIRLTIDDTIESLRRFIQDLRPPTLELLGLMPALRELCSQVKEETRLNIQLEQHGDLPQLNTNSALLIYRVVQEALTNMRKHARASEVAVCLAATHTATTISVADNGVGFDTDQSDTMLEDGRLGLMGMRERAHLLGGEIAITSEIDKGTIVKLVLEHDHIDSAKN